MPLVEWVLTPMGHYKPKEEYARLIASTNHLEMICFVTGLPLAGLPKPTKSCSDLLYEAEALNVYPRALTGQSRDNSWPNVEGENAESGEHLRYITQPWFQDDLGVVRPEFQASRVERACRSPTPLTDASANSRAVLNEIDLRLVDCNGSNKGGPFKALCTAGKSQGGTIRGRGG